MKYRRLMLLSLLLLLFLGVTVSAVTAREGVTYDPEQLTFAITRGDMETSRMLLIRATAPITELQVIPRDLLNGEKTAVLPTGTLSAALAQREITAGGLLTVPVTLRGEALPSGKFMGTLLITYHGGELTVPVTVTVKDPPLVPLLFMVAGVAAGFGVSLYRAQGRPRDQVLVRVGQVRNPMAADQKLQEVGTPFYERLEAELYDVQVALQAQDWSTAKAAIKEAEDVWGLWERERRNWLRQIGAYDELQRELEELPSGSVYRKSLEQEAREAYLTMPDRAGPAEFKSELLGIAERLNKFSELQSQIVELANSNNFLSRLRSLDAAPGNAEFETQYQALADEVAAARETARQAAETTAENVMRGGEELAFALPKSPVGTAVDAISSFFKLPRLLGSREAPASPATKVKQAIGRLQIFTWLTYLVAVGMLAAAGFNELYAGVATFGANGWGDYFALLAWGFGAEATRSSITDLLKTWELPTSSGNTTE